jgi:hypothetical protein
MSDVWQPAPPSYVGWQTGGSGFGYYGSPWLNEPVEDEKLPTRPELGVSEPMQQEYAWQQATGPFGPYGGTLPGLAMGGVVLGSWGGAGFVAPARGRYQTYRWMDLHPTIAKIKANYEAAIAAQPVEFKAKNGDDEDPMLDFVKNVFTTNLVWNFKQAAGDQVLSMGWQWWEKVWARDGGKYVFDRLDDCWPDGAKICKYQDGPKIGQFAGIMPRQGWDHLDERKSCIVNINARNNNLYGLSYNESAYDDWVTDNQVRVDEFKLRLKVSEVIPIMKYPPGKTTVVKNGETTEKNNFLVAKDMIANLAQGGGVALQNIRYEPADVQRNPKLAELGLWQLDFYDAGTLAPAINGYIDKHDHLDKRLIRAWRQSERANVESGGGASRADSETHGDTDQNQIAYVDACIVYQMQAIVDDLVMVNGGQAGDVIIAPKPMFDEEQQNSRTVMAAMMASPVFGPPLMRVLDVDDFIKKAGYATIEGSDWSSVLDEQDQQQQEQNKAQLAVMKAKAASTAPAANGNGNRMAGMK